MPTPDSHVGAHGGRDGRRPETAARTAGVVAGAVRNPGRDDTHDEAHGRTDQRSVLQGVTLLDAGDAGHVEALLGAIDQERQRIGSDPEQLARCLRSRPVGQVHRLKVRRGETGPLVGRGLPGRYRWNGQEREECEMAKPRRLDEFMADPPSTGYACHALAVLTTTLKNSETTRPADDRESVMSAAGRARSPPVARTIRSRCQGYRADGARDAGDFPPAT